MSLSSRLIGILLLLGATLPAAAQPSAPDRAALVEAQAQARRETAAVSQRFEQAQRDCAGKFAVNTCLEQARRERDEQLRGARVREVEAGDALRRFDSEQRARDREQRAAEDRDLKGGTTVLPAREGAAAAKAKAPPQSPRTVDTRQQQEAEAKRKADAAQRQAEAAKRADEQKQHAAERAKAEAEAPEKIKEYEQRQREAKERADQKLREADENRQRRERRDREREEAAKKRAAAANQ